MAEGEQKLGVLE